MEQNEAIDRLAISQRLNAVRRQAGGTSSWRVVVLTDGAPVVGELRSYAQVLAFADAVHELGYRLCMPDPHMPPHDMLFERRSRLGQPAPATAAAA
jgi:hypothetical protein